MAINGGLHRPVFRLSFSIAPVKFPSRKPRDQKRHNQRAQGETVWKSTNALRDWIEHQAVEDVIFAARAPNHCTKMRPTGSRVSSTVVGLNTALKMTRTGFENPVPV